MVERRLHLAVLVFLQLTQGLSAQEYSVLVKTSATAFANNVPMVNPGDDFTVSCKMMKNGYVLEEQLEYCQFVVPSIPNKRTLLRPGRDVQNKMQYEGDGLDKGDCGVRLLTVRDQDNGNITCYIEAGQSSEKTGSTKLIVTSAPSKVELDVWTSPENQGNLLKARCIVSDARPRANISWYLNDQLITDGLQDQELGKPCKADSGLCSFQQNLTRTLQPEDDEKTLKCVANHYGLKGTPKIAEHHIQVNFGPTKKDGPFELFGLKEGEVGRIPITIEAKPKPDIYWTIETLTIHENETKEKYTVETTQEKDVRKYETVLVINPLTAEDTERRYIVTAANKFGNTSYTVNISSSAKPEEMPTGLIVCVMLIIVLILLVLGAAYYTRAKGKFCFAVVDAEKNDSPTEGMENPAVNHNSSSEYIKNSPELKKEKPKEDTPV